MKYMEYPLYAEGYINRFLTTGIYTKPQSFKKAVLSGRVNEWLKKGFSIHENPCRKEFLAARITEPPPYIALGGSPDESITVFDTAHPLKMYLPFGNIGMEESGFYYTPTYLRSYSYAVVQSPQAQTVEFELETCGGMTLWVNGGQIIDFTPFTRNMVKRTRVSVPLKEGGNDFVICLDDLAERDTDYYFRIRSVGDSKLTVQLPVNDEVDTDRLQAAEAMLDQIYFEKEVYIGEPVKLQIRNLCGDDLKLQVVIIPGEFIEKMQEQWKMVETREYCLEKDQSALTLLHSDEIRPGYYYFAVQIDVDGIELKRKVGNQLVRRDFLEYRDETLPQRKHRILETLIEYGVDNVYKSAALLKYGREQERAERVIFEELDGVRKRQDCSDFHFTIILYIYKTHYDILSDRLKQEIEEVMAGYRYWIDEPGDDVMWFFSENHALLFHICQYLAGMNLPDRVFVNSGLTGAQLSEKAVGLLDEWFDSFFNEFITEWNSNAYIPVDVLGLGTLFNLTPEGHPLHQKAKRALDMVFYALCVNEHKGAIMTSFGRTYEKEMKGNYNAGTTGLLYVAYNAGYITRGGIGYLSIALGDYEAPQEYAAYLKLQGTQELIHQNTQGYEKHVNLYLYKNEDVLLSTAIGFKPFEPGYQEHIIQAVIDETAQVFINHPGESQPYGSGRPNFWAGNGILPMAMQYRNVSIVKYHIGDEHRIDYTHAYIPLTEFKHYKGETYTIALEKDGGYIGVKALNGLEIQEEGPCRHREFISRGRDNVWVVKVCHGSDYENLEAFFAEFNQLEIVQNEALEVSVMDGETQYRIDKQNRCYVNEGGLGERELYDYPLSVEGKLELKGEK